MIRRLRLDRAMALAVAVFALFRSADAHAQGALRIEDAVRLALARNERSRQASLRIDAAAGGVERARAAFLPTLALGATETGDATADRAGGHWSTAGVITLSQQLVAPSSWPLYAQAESTLDAEKAGSIDDLRGLAYDTAKAFLDALATEQVLAAAKGRLERARATLTDAQARAESGLASTNDATRASLDVASAAQTVAQQEGTAKKSKLALELLVGAPVETLEPPDAASRTETLIAEGIDGLIQGAPERRADVVSAHAKAEAARHFADEPHYRMAPTLGVSGQVRATPQPIAPAKPFDEVVTFTLTWPIFDGGARYGDRRQRLAQAETARLTESLLRRTVANTSRQAYVAFEAARAAFGIAQDAVTTAKKNVEETGILYRQGLAKALEVTDANAKLFDAEVALVTARIALERASLDLRFALGFDPIEGVPIGDPSTGERAR